jgi:hypothetical protein
MTAPVPTTTPGSHRHVDELDSPSLMGSDARAVGANLGLGPIVRAAVAGAPSLRYEDFPREVAKHEIEISEAAARLAGALHLHLD